MRKLEHDNHCKHIAEELEAYYNGKRFVCYNCGADFEGEQPTTCPECGAEDDIGEATLYDYMQDVLDIEYRVGSDRQIRSASFLVAFGGPNIYIDTQDHKVKLFWWNEEGEAEFDRDVADELEEMAQELFDC